jgi:hypothetical protein
MSSYTGPVPSSGQKQNKDQPPSPTPTNSTSNISASGIDHADGTEAAWPYQSTGTELDRAQPLDPDSFPNPPRKGSRYLPTTIANVRHLMRAYGIHVRYNVIKKKLFTTLPGYRGAPDNVDNVALQYIISLAILNGMQTIPIPGFVETIADSNLWNPVADWITSKPWDGVDRLPAFYATLKVHKTFDDTFKCKLMYRWSLSGVAAAMLSSGFKCRGVLTIQGTQSLGKTRWIASLVPDPLLRDEVVRLGHHLDARNKDDVISAVSHWIVEIGELDSSFKKDVAALKGFLTNDRDKIRRPYARTDSDYPRKTVFAATVNDRNFLVDPTGNTRFWVLPATKIDYAHQIDMQQLFAQLYFDYQNGEQWWLTDAEQTQLESFNKEHRSLSPVRDTLESCLDLNTQDTSKSQVLTATELLNLVGIKNPGASQVKECNAVLREMLGEPKRIRGANKWRVYFVKDPLSLLDTGADSHTNAVDDKQACDENY